MATNDEEQEPRLSDYCPVCKELMWNTENVGHVCINTDCSGDVIDGCSMYNPNTGEEYHEIEYEILKMLGQGRLSGSGWSHVDIQLHLRDAGIEGDLIEMIKNHWEDKESRTRITRLFSLITWPPYDHRPGKGRIDGE